MSIYVDFHVIQTVPPSCVNRDDTGSPKTAVYGGVTRARVSSQAWKKAIRDMFCEEFPKENIGIRTKYVPNEIAKQMQIIDGSIDEKTAIKIAKEIFKLATTKNKSPKEKSEKDDSDKEDSDEETKTDTLFFITLNQINKLARVATDRKIDIEKLSIKATSKEEKREIKKEIQEKCKKVLRDCPAIDIALFGRMVAGDPSLNFDAASQVAHAISTHAVQNEYDYFTAVDDCSPEDNAGAGHLGTVEYNSSTLYRYATVNITELRKNLKDDTVKAIVGFADAFIRSMPTGKQNTFANRTLPDAVYVTIRDDQPINMAGAFEKPIKASKDGYVEKSIERLSEYADNVYSSFLSKPIREWAIGTKIGNLENITTLKEFLEELKNEVESDISEER